MPKYQSNILECSYYTMDIDFIRDYQEVCKNQLLRFGYKCDATSDCVNLFFNVKKRLLSRVPRKVVKAKEFVCPAEYACALQEIEYKITNGESLIPYMSDKILDASYKDMLLYDWNIYHLHLSRRKRSDGFVQRSKYQLFLYEKDLVVYFLQIYPHNKDNLYTTKEMVKILHDNWPELIQQNKIEGSLYGCNDLDDAEYGRLRDSGITTFVDLGNGIMYSMLGGGYASNCSSLDVTRNADHWRQRIKQYETLVAENVKQIIFGIASLKKCEANRDLSFKMLYINDEGITVFESSNQMCLQLYWNENYFRICFPQELFGSLKYDEISERNMIKERTF